MFFMFDFIFGILDCWWYSHRHLINRNMVACIFRFLGGKGFTVATTDKRRQIERKRNTTHKELSDPQQSEQTDGRTDGIRVCIRVFLSVCFLYSVCRLLVYLLNPFAISNQLRTNARDHTH